MEADCHGGRQRNPKGVVRRPSGSRDVGAHITRCGQPVVTMGLVTLGEAVSALVCS